MTAHQPILIRKRVFEGKNFWGVIGERNQREERYSFLQMIGLDQNDYDFIVDINHQDRPAKVQLVQHAHANGITYYPRTIGDKSRANNFSNVPKVQYGHARRIKVYKK